MLGALCARLSSNAESVSSATGAKVGQTLTGITTLIVGVSVAVFYNWRLGLVTSMFIPMSSLGLLIRLRAQMQEAKALKKSLEKSSKIAMEAIANIRTVAGLSHNSQ